MQKFQPIFNVVDGKNVQLSVNMQFFSFSPSQCFARQFRTFSMNEKFIRWKFGVLQKKKSTCTQSFIFHIYKSSLCLLQKMCELNRRKNTIVQTWAYRNETVCVCVDQTKKMCDVSVNYTFSIRQIDDEKIVFNCENMVTLRKLFHAIRTVAKTHTNINMSTHIHILHSYTIISFCKRLMQFREINSFFPCFIFEAWMLFMRLIRSMSEVYGWWFFESCKIKQEMWKNNLKFCFILCLEFVSVSINWMCAVLNFTKKERTSVLRCCPLDLRRFIGFCQKLKINNPEMMVV